MKRHNPNRHFSVILVLGFLLFLLVPSVTPPTAGAKTQHYAEHSGSAGDGEGKPEDWGSPQTQSSPSISARVPVVWQVLIDSAISYLRWWF